MLRRPFPEEGEAGVGGGAGPRGTHKVAPSRPSIDPGPRIRSRRAQTRPPTLPPLVPPFPPHAAFLPKHPRVVKALTRALKLLPNSRMARKSVFEVPRLSVSVNFVRGGSGATL